MVGLRRPVWRSVLSASVITVLAVSVSSTSAQAPVPADAAAGRKQARQVRAADGALRVAGGRDDAARESGPPITDFEQKEPVEGVAPADATDVRTVYDDEAIYVRARMTSGQPIVAPLGRRDEPNQAEHLLVSLDAYLDRRTASTFGITAAGVRIDRYYASDDEDRKSTRLNSS